MLHHSPTANLDNDVNNDPDGDSDNVVVVTGSEDHGVLLDHNPVVAVIPTTSMGTASNPQVATNIVISFVGAGITGLPNAFWKAGWLLSSCTLLTVLAFNVYCMLLLPQTQQRAQLLLRSQQHNKNVQQPRWSYGELGRHIMGPHGEVLVNICLEISQAGFATAYIIFIAANLYNIAAIPRASLE
jgi:proton-coupled amino acid transporter